MCTQKLSFFIANIFVRNPGNKPICTKLGFSDWLHREWEAEKGSECGWRTTPWKTSALPRLLQAAHRQRSSKSLQLPNTAPQGDGRHEGDHINLLNGHAGTSNQTRIAKSSTYIHCQGGYDSCCPSRFFQEILQRSEQL